MTTKRTKRVLSLCAGVTLALWGAPLAQADVALEWRTDATSVAVGDVIDVKLYAVWDPDGPMADYGPEMCGMELLLVWDPGTMELLGVNNDGPYDWMVSELGDDPFCLNFDLTDGDARYRCLAAIGVPPAVATDDGLHVTTLQFEALEARESVTLGIQRQYYQMRSLVASANYTGAYIHRIPFGTLDLTITEPDAGGDGDGEIGQQYLFPFEGLFSEELADGLMDAVMLLQNQWGLDDQLQQAQP